MSFESDQQQGDNAIITAGAAAAIVENETNQDVEEEKPISIYDIHSKF